MKWYSINKISGSLFADSDVVQAKNSKEALEKLLGKKVKRIHAESDFRQGKGQYSVTEGDEQGRIYRDRRKRNFYDVINNIQVK